MHTDRTTSRSGRWAPLAALLLLHAASAPAQEPREALPRAFPSVVHLGKQAAGTIARESIWLMNATPDPLRVVAAKGNCGCTAVTRFEPTTLAPDEVMEVPVTLEVPATVGKRITKSFWFTFEEGDPLGVPITVESESPRNISNRLEPEDVTMSPLRAVPSAIDVGPVPAGESRTFDVWLFNPTDRPLEVVRGKPFCDCNAVEMSPMVIPPKRADQVRVSMTAPKEIGRRRSGGVAFVLASGGPFRLPMRIEARHPLVARTFTFLDAHDSGDEVAAVALLADGAVVWKEERRGPGTPAETTIFDRWSGWNWELNRIIERVDFACDGATVTGILVERNDVDKLLERPARRRQVTAHFDETSRIDWLLYKKMPAEKGSAGRFREFLGWARSNEPEELAQIFADGKVTPNRNHAWRWREILIRWREAAGLPPVQLR